MAKAFTFDLVSPEKLVFSGEVLQTTVPGSEGYFCVMENHAPFMSTVKPGVLEVKLDDGREMNFFVVGGVADVSSNGLTVLAEKAMETSFLDSEVIAREIEGAQAALEAAIGTKKVAAYEKLEQLKEVKATLGL